MYSDYDAIRRLWIASSFYLPHVLKKPFVCLKAVNSTLLLGKEVECLVAVLPTVPHSLHTNALSVVRLKTGWSWTASIPSVLSGEVNITASWRSRLTVKKPHPFNCWMHCILLSSGWSLPACSKTHPLSLGLHQAANKSFQLVNHKVVISRARACMGVWL